ncbi:MAG: hypothetical protein H8E71_00485 [Candidatus Marinimicrobia bacterium]|nr:hypothetical protein [Candidatus Neomarinimicrobiota bacterium]MBL7109347.1 hypothetical protein [Candidatus Neomarinimicrobiota bacterium]
MKFYKYNIAILTGIILMMISGCATTYTVHLIDEESQKPAPNIPIEILDENGRDQLKSDESNAEGQYIIYLKTIPGDSFKIEIKGDDYFEINEWITTPGKSAESRFILEKRLTIIKGYVNETEEYGAKGIGGVEVKIKYIVKAETDTTGMFKLKSNKLMRNKDYTIYVNDKDGKYKEGTTNIRPKINETNQLTAAVILERKVKEKVIIDTTGGEDTEIPQNGDGVTTGTKNNQSKWRAFDGNNPRTKMGSSELFQNKPLQNEQWTTVWMKSTVDLTSENNGLTVTTSNKILECWIGDSKIKDVKHNKDKWEVKFNESDSIDGKRIFIKFKIKNPLVFTSIEIK